MFEVQDLRYATLATVSRCGMVWFSEDLLTSEMVFENYMMKLRNIPLEDTEEEYKKMAGGAVATEGQEEVISPTMQVPDIWSQIMGILVLRRMAVFGRFSTIFVREATFVTSRLLSYPLSPFRKGSTFKGKKIAP